MNASLFYRDECRAGAAFVLVSELETRNRFVPAQKFMHALPKCARSFAVNNQNLLEPGKLRVVYEFAANLFSLVNGHAANINAPFNRFHFLQKSERAAILIRGS